MIAYSVVVLISDVAGTYVFVIVGLAGVSLAFYGFQQAAMALSLDVEALTRPVAVYDVNVARSIFVHTFYFDQLSATRNSGFFWEPGALAGYVNLGLVFLCLMRQRFTSKGFMIRFVVLSVCLLTTQSTIGYVAYGVVMCLEMITGAWYTPRTRLIRLLCGTCAIAVLWTVSMEIEFMRPKIEHSISLTTTRSGQWQADRLGTVMFDLEYITKRPFTGWGLNDATRMLLNPEASGAALTGRGNGMTDFAAKFGVGMLLLWVTCSYLTVLRVAGGHKAFAIIGLVPLLISLNGECFLNYPLFLTFFFNAAATLDVPKSLQSICRRRTKGDC